MTFGVIKLADYLVVTAVYKQTIQLIMLCWHLLQNAGNKQTDVCALFLFPADILFFLFQKVVITEFDVVNFRIKAEG